MSTKESHLVRDYVGEKFSRYTNTGQVKWLPSILAIMADLMDVQSTLGDTEKCRVAYVNCLKTQCKRYDECERRYRQFYIYSENHKCIFKSADQLPDGLGINSKYKKSSKPEIVKETDAFSARVKGEVIYRHYEKGDWKSCYCTLESYKDILASIFFFCPDILWCAVKAEMNNVHKKRIDGDVVQAIVRSLDFYVLLDKLERKYGEEICKNIDLAVVQINNLHSISEIEDIAIWSKEADSTNVDRILNILEAGSKGIDFVCKKISTSTCEKKYAIKVMGRKNYKYLSKIANMYFKNGNDKIR